MKTTVTQEPLLSFEFASETGEIKPYTFRNPIKVITTDTIEDILLCFQHIQEAIDAGYYAAGYLSYECAPAFDPAFKVKKDIHSRYYGSASFRSQNFNQSAARDILMLRNGNLR